MGEARCPFCGAAQRETFAPIAVVLGFAAGVSACGPQVDEPTMDGGSTTSGDTTASTSGSASNATTGPSTSVGPSTTIEPATTIDPATTFDPSTTAVDTDDFTTDDSVGPGFIYGDPDGGPFDECSVEAQDCPRGEKCMPWSADGGDGWNAMRCSPLAPDPGQVHDACRVEGSPWSGVDDCDIGLTCASVDEATNEGWCLALCSYVSALECDPETECTGTSFAGECRPTCNPMAAVCPHGWECVTLGNGVSVCA